MELVQALAHAPEPWVAYNALVDLVGENPDSPTAVAAYAALRSHPYEHILAWQRFDGGRHPNELNLPGGPRESESMIPSVHIDSRYREMLDALLAHRDDYGRVIADGVNQPYKAFVFGQKKQPSAWLSFLVARILHRSTVPN